MQWQKIEYLRVSIHLLKRSLAIRTLIKSLYRLMNNSQCQIDRLHLRNSSRLIGRLVVDPSGEVIEEILKIIFKIWMLGHQIIERIIIMIRLMTVVLAGADMDELRTTYRLTYKISMNLLRPLQSIRHHIQDQVCIQKLNITVTVIQISKSILKRINNKIHLSHPTIIPARAKI